MNNTMFTIITIVIIAVVTFILRSLAFFAFPEGKEIPRVVQKLGTTLPYGIMAFLVVYCLKDTVVTAHPYGIPEAIALVLTAGLQAWRRNSLLSVLIGTAGYMIMVQFIF